MLSRPTPQVDVSTLQAAVESLRADIDMILEARVPESDAPCVEAADDTVLAALFANYEIPPSPPRDNAKMCRGREEDEARARKKEHREIEAARRASLAEGEAHKMRASELAAGASSSRTVEIAGGTTDGAVVAEDTTEGVQIAEDVGSGNRTHHLADRRRFAPQVCFTYQSSIESFMHWGQLHAFLLGVG